MKITHVISANAINNVLWPQRAIIPIMSISWIYPNHEPSVCPATRVLYGGETVHFQASTKHASCLKTSYFPVIFQGKCPADAHARDLDFSRIWDDASDGRDLELVAH